LADETITLTRPAEPVNAVADRRPRLPKRLSALSGVLGGTALIALHGSTFGNWIVDDAAITFAYARNVAEGHGPVLQPGAEPTEGFSNPTWLVLLALGRLTGLFDHGTVFGVPDYIFFPKALAVACCAGILAACHVAAKRITGRPALVTLLCGLVLAANTSFVVWVFSGLENSLFGLAVIWLAVVMFTAAVDDRLLSAKVAVLAGGFAALAALTRPDGLIYGAAYPLLVLVHIRRPTLSTAIRAAGLSVLTFVVPVGGYFTWRHLEFGKLLSLPALAKSQGTPTIDDLNRASELVVYTGTLAVIAFCVFVGIVLGRPSKLRTGMVALLITLALAVVAYVVLNPDWMPLQRFATPVWTVGALAVTLAVWSALRNAGIRGRALIAVGLVVTLIPSGSLWATASQKMRADPTVPMCLVAERLGRAFNGYADAIGVKQGSLLLPDVGATAMTSRLRVLDLAGLTEPRLAEFWGNQQWRELGDYVFDVVKPTFIHSHEPWSDQTGVLGDSRLNRDYVPISTFDNGDFVRKDVLTGQSMRDELLRYSDQVAIATTKILGSPRGGCGAVLRPAQTPIGAPAK
jgi:hypothetical protein